MSDIIGGVEGPSLDFGSISARVSEHLSTLEDSPSVESTPSITQEHQPQASSGTPPEQSLDAAVVEKDSQPSEYTLPDGTKATAQQIAEWRKGNMLQSDYTKKTQEVAEMRRASEEVFKAYKAMEQERAELVSFLNDPQQIAQYLQTQFAQQQQFNPEMVPTIGDVQQLTQREIGRLQTQLQQMQQDFTKQLETTATSTREQIAYEAQEAQYAKQIQGEFEKMFDQFPILKAIPNAEHNIRFEVFQMNPQSDEQMFEAMWETAQKHVDNIERTYSELNKSKMVRAESLTQNNTQPPGGTGLQPEPAKSRYNSKDNKVDFKNVYADAVSYLKSRQ